MYLLSFSFIQSQLLQEGRSSYPTPQFVVNGTQVLTCSRLSMSLPISELLLFIYFLQPSCRLWTSICPHLFPFLSEAHIRNLAIEQLLSTQLTSETILWVYNMAAFLNRELMGEDTFWEGGHILPDRLLLSSPPVVSHFQPLVRWPQVIPHI